MQQPAHKQAKGASGSVGAAPLPISELGGLVELGMRVDDLESAETTQNMRIDALQQQVEGLKRIVVSLAA